MREKESERERKRGRGRVFFSFLSSSPCQSSTDALDFFFPFISFSLPTHRHERIRRDKSEYAGNGTCHAFNGRLRRHCLCREQKKKRKTWKERIRMKQRELLLLLLSFFCFMNCNASFLDTLSLFFLSLCLLFFPFFLSISTSSLFFGILKNKARHHAERVRHRRDWVHR